MKRFAIVFLAFAMMLCSLASCGTEKDKSAESKDNSGDTAELNENTVEESTENMVYADGLIIEAYLPVMAPYFVESYSEGDDLSEKDLLHLTVQFIYSQRSDLTASAADNDESFAVRESDVVNTAKALFGNGVDPADMAKFIDPSMGESFDADNRVYYFTAASVSYSPNGYTVSFDEEPEITEEEKTVTATVTVYDGEQNSHKMTYTFHKSVFNEYMYTRLSSAEIKND